MSTISKEIICPKCEEITEFGFLSKKGCYLRKDLDDNWQKGCDYVNIPNRLQEVIDKILYQGQIT